jgi:hypothetical protein
VQVPKALEGRILLWDLKNVPALARFTEYIADPDNRALQQKVRGVWRETCGGVRVFHSLECMAVLHSFHLHSRLWLSCCVGNEGALALCFTRKHWWIF